jgi:hypothetical protein
MKRGLFSPSSRVAAVLLLAGVGCAKGGEVGGTQAEPLPACTGPVLTGPSPMRRLTRFEYDNTVRDLLGDEARPARAFPPEELGNGFGNDATSLTVSRLLAEQYAVAARGLSERLLADRPRFIATLGCGPADDEATCARGFIERFGARAWRRPLAAEERDRLFALYGRLRALPQTFDEAAGGVIQAMLQAPQFLYRVELGTPVAGDAKLMKVGQYEMASRLSYFLWGSMPDAPLFAEAEAGRLGTAAEVRAQAERMLGDARARQVVRYFNRTLFGLAGIQGISKSTELFPAFTSQVPSLLQEETERFLDDVIWDGAGDLKTLLTAPYSFMNADLARYYGVDARPDAPKGTAFERVSLDPTRAAGLLTQAGLMASLTPGTQTNPVLRGLFVRRTLLCSAPPPPPPALMVREPEPDPTLTTRERFRAHSDNKDCAACHKFLDPIGFTFEHYDAIGRWRDTDNGRPVDTSGEIFGTDVAGPVKDAVQLAGKLASSRAVESCMVGHWLTFGYGRRETPDDACTRARLEQAFTASGGRFRDLLIALTQTDAFLYRPAELPQ